MSVSSYILGGTVDSDPNPSSKTYFQNGPIASIDSITSNSE
jgi:hypothetical protein